MFLFFKQIGKNILDNNKIGTLLIFAIGEIILVVAGILIAVWIEESVDDQERKSKITSLMDQMVIELDNQLNYHQNDSLYLSMRVSYLSKMANGDLDKINLSEFLVNFLITINQPQSFNNSFSSLREQGLLENLENQDLKRLILKHYGERQALMNSVANWQYSFTSNEMEPYILESLPFRFVDLKNALTDVSEVQKLYKNSMEFRSRINYQLYSNVDVLDRTTQHIQSIREVRNMLIQELLED